MQAVGSAVRQVSPGDRVMVHPTLSCGQCAACKSGEDPLCARLRVIGEHYPGTAAEYIVVPAQNLAFVPEKMPWPDATTGPVISLDLRRLFWHQWTILGATLGSRREYGEIHELAHAGKLWPVVDQIVPLDEAQRAFERLQRGEQMGKLVIEVTQ